ncbi:MAG: toxin subunit [Brevibacillus sp.]|nr:toxin subunit [Brevibacillus sp.]
MEELRNRMNAVDGHIKLPSGVPAAGLQVVAYDKQFRSEREIGATITNREGRYRIAYPIDSRMMVNSGGINLVIQVKDEDGSILASSRVLFNAGEDENVNLTVKAAGYSTVSDYEQVQTILSGILGTIEADQLTEEDMLFLGKQENLDQHRLENYIQAQRLAASTGISAELLYGLASQYIPLSLPKLLALRGPKLTSLLEQAVDNGIIGQILLDEIPTFTAQLQKLLMNGAMGDKRLQAESGLQLLLEAANLTKTDQDMLIELAFQHDEEPESFWNMLREHEGFAKKAGRVQMAMQLGTLTGCNMPLVTAILKKLDEGKNAEPTLCDVAFWDEHIWRGILEDSSENTTSDTEHRSIHNIKDVLASDVKNIMKALDQAYPTAGVIRKLKQDESFPMRTELIRFFERNPDFDLQLSSVDEFVASVETKEDATSLSISKTRSQKDEGDHLSSKESKEVGLAAQLKSMQRIFRLVPEYDSTSALLKGGVHSAYGVAKMGQQGFISQYGDKVGGEHEARRIYDRASQVAATALTMFSQYHEAFHAVQFSATITDHSSGVAALASSLPDWSDMFGSADWCDCDQCRTVYSPAAYLVDLLQFLSKIPAKQGNALHALFERRPDIGTLELSCENTNTTLPYVDLVNEILENAVSPETSVETSRTSGTSELLGASPQYVNGGAYDTLAEQLYPWHLPYALWTEEARLYLEHLNVKRDELMEAFRPFQSGGDLPVSELFISAERLKLSEMECRIITGTLPASPPLYKLWGFSENQIGEELWINALQRVPLFLQQTGLDYAELEHLLAARFINPDGQMRVVFNESQYSLDEAVIVSLSEGALERIHRFVRLQRKLDWPIGQLDQAVCALSDGQLNETFIIELANAARLQKELNVPFLEILQWWMPIETIPSPGENESLYDRLFLNKTILDPVDAVFALREPQRNELVDPTQAWENHQSTILAALQIGSEELKQLAGVCLSNHYLTLSNLSQLYRHAAFAKAIRLTIPDYVSFRTLIPSDPFAPGGDKGKRALQFVRFVKEVLDSGFRIHEWGGLLLHHDVASVASIPTEKQITELLTTIREDLKQNENDLSGVWDNSEAWVASTLSQMFPKDVVDKMIILISQEEPVLNEMQARLIDDWFSSFVDPREARDMFDSVLHRESRFEYIAGVLQSHRYMFLNTQALNRRLVDFVQLDPEIVGLFLFSILRNPAVPSQKMAYAFFNIAFVQSTDQIKPERFRELYHSVLRLAKIGAILNRLGLKKDEIIFMIQSNFSEPLNWNDIPVEPAAAPPVGLDLFMRLYRLVSWRDHYASGKTEWIELLRDVSWNQNQSALPESVIERLSGMTGWNTEAIKYWIGADALHFRFPLDYRDERWLIRLAEGFTLTHRLNVPPQTARAWAVPSLTAVEAGAIKQAVKVRYDYQQWLTIAKTFRDKLRETQRNMLTSHLIHTMGNISSADDLFAHFLIDVEMGVLQQTSRITQAISSVQLFVQRCLMNLEPDVTVSPYLSHDWQTIRNYRVWEANRKIFLYPENWLEPDLRDNKSSFFNDLEKEFMENEATTESAEAALFNYMEKLDQVSRLDICAMYHQYEDHGDGHFTDILHVFGRTQNSPYVYFYRRFENGLSWTAWEKVDVDIEGEHLIPVMYKSRLYLFWPTFTEMAKQPTSVNQAGQLPEKYLQIGLAWSEYRFGKWSPKTVTNASLDMTGYEKEELSFHTELDENNDLIIDCQKKYFGGYTLYTRLFYFKLSNPNGKVDVFPVYSDLMSMKFPAPASAFMFNNTISRFGINFPRLIIPIDTNGDGSVEMAPYETADVMKLQSDPNTKIIYPQNNDCFDGSRPFFYQDSKRVLFVTSSPFHSINSLLVNNRFMSNGYVLPLSSPYGGSYLLMHAAFHPYVTAFVENLNTGGIDRLLSIETQSMAEENFVAIYEPNVDRVNMPYPAENVDFTSYGPYSLYNWEIFFHTPLMLADRLSKNQHFEESQRWFHYIFNPMDASSASPERFWRLLPFRMNDAKQSLQEYMMLLQYNGNDPEMLTRKLELEKLIAAWKNDPFNPHLIARIRISAYQKSVVMKYLDNLIAWGDQLFRKETIESINEATQMYIIAAELLGERPRTGPKQPNFRPNSYTDLAPKLDAFSNALVQLENWIPASSEPVYRNESVAPSLLSIGTALYFSIPPNDKLLGYWDTVADRLFKIRNSMNIDGVVRQMPLFQPPIDPGVLARAASAGVDIASAVQEANGPLPQYRYSTVVHKSMELCGEVKTFGSALLTALEKRDTEKLSLLRSGHEASLLNAMLQVKQKQVEESKETLQGLYQSKELIQIRLEYYNNRPFINIYEQEQLNKLKDANDRSHHIMRYEIAAQLATQIPNVTIGTSGVASPVITAQLGGSNLSTGLQARARYLNHYSLQDNYKASRSATLGSYERRRDDWNLQANLAKTELLQIDKQIAAAEIRLSIAEQELRNQEAQIRNSQEIERYMKEKYTNAELYDWMVSQTSALYFQSYNMAYDMAKRAERAFQFELGTDKTYIKFGYWDSMKKGLLSGDKLLADLKRMDLTYLEQNKREYELTKHISIALTDPLALILLKETGECYVELPESLFDMDYPGHYMRRIKSVSVSIPCVTGPYSGVNSTLTLLHSSIRKNSSLSGGKYARTSDEDIRFADQFGINQSIATSSAQSDSGMFELNLRDERYLPFEGAGAVSRWKIELPKACNTFDTDSVSDVVLHLRYTAREGGGALKAAFLDEWANANPPQNQLLLLSARTEMSGEWHRFLHPVNALDGQQLLLNLSSMAFPYKHRDKNIELKKIELFLKWKDCSDYDSGAPLKVSIRHQDSLSEIEVALPANPFYGGVPHAVTALSPSDLGEWHVAIKEADIAQLAEAYRQTITDGDTIHYRLKAEAIEDMLILFHYEVG